MQFSFLSFSVFVFVSLFFPFKENYAEYFSNVKCIEVLFQKNIENKIINHIGNYDEEVQIVPLEAYYIPQVEKIVYETWGIEGKVAMSHIKYSLDNKIQLNLLDKETRQVFRGKSFRHWILVDVKLDKVYGIIGLYENEKDYKEAFWLSWYTVISNQSSKGYGKRLLNYVIDKARKEGKSYLRLDTGEPLNEREEIAQKIYDKMGFYVFKKFDSNYDIMSEPYETWYRERKL